ncbi:hypothetical protein D0Z06_18975 [Geodermatophilus marinus]|nr:hypothetical protein D0Z06_18975 [Geodermatophilus sp. LHW52908]
MYSSLSTDPAEQIALTDLGGGSYRVDLPADDGVNGPIGLLSLKPIDSSHDVVVSAGAGFGLDTFGYWLDLSAGGPAAVTLSPQATLNAWLDGPSLRAGESLDVTIPAGSWLDTHGFPGMGVPTAALAAAEHDLRTGPAVPVTPAVSADGRTATVTVPAGTTAGSYLLVIAVGEATDEVIARAVVRLEVSQALNTGLRSDTGWVEEAPAGAGTSPLVPLGAGMVLTAGTVAVLVLRRRAGTRS